LQVQTNNHTDTEMSDCQFNKSKSELSFNK